MKPSILVPSLWLPLVLAIAPAWAQTARQEPRAPAAAEREPSRLQMGVMEDAFQRAVEATHARAVDITQMAAGMPPLFSFEGNTRARGFRIEGYGVFFDVDMPPIPRTVEWQLRVLDTGAMLQPDIEQLQRQLAQLNDPRVTRALAPILKNMQSKVSAGSSMAGASGQGERTGVKPALVGDGPGASGDPFRAYLNELKRALVQIMLEYGPSVRLGADDWLHVAAREMAPRLMPGNPTDATITLRIKAADLAALKAGRLAHDEAVRRVEVKEVF